MGSSLSRQVMNWGLDKHTQKKTQSLFLYLFQKYSELSHLTKKKRKKRMVSSTNWLDENLHWIFLLKHWLTVSSEMLHTEKGVGILDRWELVTALKMFHEYMFRICHKCIITSFNTASIEAKLFNAYCWSQACEERDVSQLLFILDKRTSGIIRVWEQTLA